MMTRRDLLALPALGLVSRFVGTPLAIADDVPTTARLYTGAKKPTDFRLGPPKTLNDYFPFAVPKTREEWETRRKQLREQLLVANGLWPLPEKTPLNPVVHGKLDRDGYTIEKVFFASMPGHYVTGNLYRPKLPGGAAKAPGVLFAHGHWANGRFHDAGEKAAEASVKAGGEPDLDRGRFFMQAIPIQLARMGFVAFQYDMVGYADSTAIPHREGFKDTDAELRLQSQMGLQSWNSIRALDFLASLPDVDPKRLGMTGASGGGTQTFITAALDDRLAAVFPAVMVSTAMQGGCVCENCSHLRVGTGNVEIAAVFAPKPMAFSAANDWTKEFMTKGYPELKDLYRLYGAEEKVAAKAWLEYGHQYNVHAREFMYQWFRTHLTGGKPTEVKEQPYKPTPPKELSVFDEAHPRPKDELNAAKLREVMTRASDAQMKAIEPKDAKSLAEYRRVVGTALRVLVHDQLPTSTKAIYRVWPQNVVVGDHTGLIEHLGREGAYVPALGMWMKGSSPYVLWLHPKGKASLYADGKIAPVVQKLTAAGCHVVAPDLIGTGETASEKLPPVDKAFAGFTFGYNRSLLANRVFDALTVVAEMNGRQFGQAKPIHLVGWGEFGPVAILVRALVGDVIAKTAADLNQFRFENIKDTADPMMLSGAVKYGGLPAFLALCAPGPMLTHNHKGTATGHLVQAAYDAAGAKDQLTRSPEKLDDVKVIEWLIK